MKVSIDYFHKGPGFLLKPFLIIYLFFNFTPVQAQQYDCSRLPLFSTEHEAIDILRDTRFDLNDSADVSLSSWIVSAIFLSCEGEPGFMIFSARYTDYIYQDVPQTIWSQFKMARDKDSYYMKAIKNKYDLKKK